MQFFVFFFPKLWHWLRQEKSSHIETKCRRSISPCFSRAAKVDVVLGSRTAFPWTFGSVAHQLPATASGVGLQLATSMQVAS